MMKRRASFQIIALLLALVMSLTSCDMSFLDSLGDYLVGDESNEESGAGGNESGEDVGNENGTGSKDESEEDENHPLEVPALTAPKLDLSSIPEYSDSAYITLNDNLPEFKKYQYTTTSYEYYSELDSLGRCGVTVATLGVDLMPTGNRGSINSVYPTGWNKFVDDDGNQTNFYERSHLIGWQLSGENAN